VRWRTTPQGLSSKNKGKLISPVMQMHTGRGEKPHPLNYRGCSDVKEESLSRRAELAPTTKTKTRRVFFSQYANPTFSIAAAVGGNPIRDKLDDGSHCPSWKQWKKSASASIICTAALSGPTCLRFPSGYHAQRCKDRTADRGSG